MSNDEYQQQRTWISYEEWWFYQYLFNRNVEDIPEDIREKIIKKFEEDGKQ